MAGKDLALTGDSVTIDPGYDQRTRKETFEQKQSGLSVALSGAVGGALNTAVSSAQQARKEGDGRLNALQNTKAALSGVQAAQAWERDNALTASAEAKRRCRFTARRRRCGAGRHQYGGHQRLLRQSVVEKRNPHRQPTVAGQHAHRRAKPVDNGDRQEPMRKAAISPSPAAS